jgi:hypothetical protein
MTGYDPFPGWHWRNCREIGFGMSFWPLTWVFGFERSGDVYGVVYHLSLGPLLLQLHANIGDVNRSVPWRGLSGAEAYDRACRFGGRPYEHDEVPF